MMKKFLNFSTILFSYVLITVLVISCGGSSGGGGGTGGSSVGDATNGTDGGGVPQPGAKDDCLLADRADKDSWMAILCYDGVVMATIAKDATDPQQINFLIPSTANAGGNPSRTWDLSKKDTQIQISHVKDYTLALFIAEDGSIAMIADATDATEPVDAEYLLQRLNINSFLTDSKDALRAIGMTFSPTSGNSISVLIVPKLAVKSQEDFISMGNVSIPEFTASADYKVPFVLENDLNLVAPGGEGAKFDSAIIGVAEKAFNFDGGGKTINLNSEIDAVANDKPAAIIGEIKRAVTLQNFTLNVNQPISGTEYVSTIIANASSGGLIQNIKININGSLSLYKPNVYSTDSKASYVGGVVGKSCADINNVVVKTGNGAVIQASIADIVESYAEDYFVGGLVAVVDCPATSDVVTSNNLVDVTLGSFASDGITGNGLQKNGHWIGGLISEALTKVIMQNNLVRLSMSRGNNLSADFFAQGVAGFVHKAQFLQSAANNLVYVDFSNLGKYKNVGGLFYELNNLAEANNIANNMVFIADGFNWENVDGSYEGGGDFGSIGLFTAKVETEGAVANLTDSFFSMPITLEFYNFSSLAPVNISFVTYPKKDINFKNLIVDFKTAGAMFKLGDTTIRDALRAKIPTANIFTLAEAKTNQLSTIFPENSTSWEEDSNGYPQLKAPSNLIGSLTKAEIEEAWTATNDLIQTGLADREASRQ